MSKHATLLKEAKKAIDAVYADNSVPPQETEQSMMDLREHIDILMTTLDPTDERYNE